MAAAMWAELARNDIAAGGRHAVFAQLAGEAQGIGWHHKVDRAIGCQMLTVLAPADARHLGLGSQLELHIAAQAAARSFGRCSHQGLRNSCTTMVATDADSAISCQREVVQRRAL